MFDLAPGTHRQRIAVEWRRWTPITRPEIRRFSRLLAARMAMDVLHLDITYADPFGEGATCHWKYSGWALMGWDTPADPGVAWGHLPFGTLDLHCCQPYADDTVVGAVREFFTPAWWPVDGADTELLTWRPVLPELAR